MYCTYAAITRVLQDCNSCIHNYNICITSHIWECMHKLDQKLQKQVQDEDQGLLENAKAFGI